MIKRTLIIEKNEQNQEMLRTCEVQTLLSATNANVTRKASAQRAEVRAMAERADGAPARWGTRVRHVRQSTAAACTRKAARPSARATVGKDCFSIRSG